MKISQFAVLAKYCKKYLKFSRYFYSYSQLAIKSEMSNHGGDELPNTKRVTPDWSVGIGEEASHVQVVPSDAKDTQSAIVVLGRKALYIVYDTGMLKFSRKLDFVPTTIKAYRPRKSHTNLESLNLVSMLSYPQTVIGQDQLTIIISSDTGNLMLFENTTIRWAAQLPFTPLNLTRGSFKVRF